MNPTNASAITPNRWEELKQWVQDTAQNEANHASIDQAGNQYAVSESRGRISAHEEAQEVGKMIHSLKMVLAVLSNQLDAAVAEVSESNIAPLITVRQTTELMRLVMGAIVQLKRGSDRPDENRRILENLLATLRQMAKDERFAMDGRNVAAALLQYRATASTIAQIEAIAGARMGSGVR